MGDGPISAIRRARRLRAGGWLAGVLCGATLTARHFPPVEAALPELVAEQILLLAHAEACDACDLSDLYGSLLSERLN